MTEEAWNDVFFIQASRQTNRPTGTVFNAIFLERCYFLSKAVFILAKFLQKRMAWLPWGSRTNTNRSNPIYAASLKVVKAILDTVTVVLQTFSRHSSPI